MAGGVDRQERPDSNLAGHGGEALSSLLIYVRVRNENVSKQTWVGSHISHVWANSFLCHIQHPYEDPDGKGHP